MVLIDLFDEKFRILFEIRADTKIIRLKPKPNNNCINARN